jgi:N-acetylneuraminic acid mutarotase
MKYLLTTTIVVLSFCTFGQTENFWTKKADFSGLKRERAVAFSIGDFGYIGTGVDTAEVVLDDFWKYDPSADTWSQIADLPGGGRRNAIAFTIGDFGYVGTGMDSIVASAPGAQTLSDFWKFEPLANSWTQIASYPGNFGNGIYFSTGFSIDSKAYLCGGKMGPNFYSNQLWEYKPSLDQWTQLQNFPGGLRYQLASFSIGFKAYVGFGTDQDIYRKDIWEFDATTNQWTAKADFPASERASTTAFTIDQRGFVTTGANGGMLDDLWQYNPSADSWSLKATYGGSPRKNAIGFVINGKAYVGTGKGYSGKKASMHEYTPGSVLGTDEIEIELAMYPNPTSDYVNLNYVAEQIDEIALYSISGEMLTSGSGIQTIQVSDFAQGNYIVVGRKDNQIVSTQYLIRQ